MTLRALTSLTLCTAAVATASTTWASPAHAILLRFTGFSANTNERIQFGLETGSEISDLNDLIDLDPGSINVSIVDFTYLNNIDAENSTTILTANTDANLEVISPISDRFQDIADPNVFIPDNGIGFGVSPSGGFANDSEYFLEFDSVIQETVFPSLSAGDVLNTQITFGIGNDRTSETPDIGVLTIDDLLGTRTPVFRFRLDEEVESVPEPTALLGFVAMSFFGVAHASRKGKRMPDAKTNF